jgi:type IV pilus assembly protein PilA
MPNFGRRRAQGFSLIELLVVIAIILIIMSIAMPKIQQAKNQAQGAAAIGAIRTIHTAQAQYQSQYGRFASTISELGPPANGAPGISAAALIGSDLAKGVKGGYKYSLQASESGYTINANPITFTAGKHTYYSDESLVTRHNDTAEPATAASPEINPQ